MRLLFATPELTPLARVGGLGEAAAGLVAALRRRDVTVDVVLPDYGDVALSGQTERTLHLPAWAQPAAARTGITPGVGKVTLVRVPGIARPHPYVDDEGQGWPDNDLRFFAFSAAVARLTEITKPDVLHLNDWHTAATLAFIGNPPPTALTIHTLGYQGWADGDWMGRFPHYWESFEWAGNTNPLAGGIRLADRVIAVSPNYAAEIRRPESGMGLHELLTALGDRLIGIRNGIDTTIWDPATDPHLAANYTSTALGGKERCRAELMARAGWHDDGTPIVGLVTRLVDQKGIDLLLEAMQFAANVPFRLVLLGSGDRGLADWARFVAGESPELAWFHDGYDLELAHQIFAGSDLLAMPSRFEPCGLAQMQAMAYGTIPVVTDVGGLHDTVADADADRAGGTGFIAGPVTAAGLVDALHRAVRAWRHPRRRQAIQRRGMEQDWSWQQPAARHLDLYQEMLSRG
jgi:starch synthase